jgi:hypothetical protein
MTPLKLIMTIDNLGRATKDHTHYNNFVQVRVSKTSPQKARAATLSNRMTDGRATRMFLDGPLDERFFKVCVAGKGLPEVVQEISAAEFEKFKALPIDKTNLPDWRLARSIRYFKERSKPGMKVTRSKIVRRVNEKSDIPLPEKPLMVGVLLGGEFLNTKVFKHGVTVFVEHELHDWVWKDGVLKYAGRQSRGPRDLAIVYEVE